MHSRAHAHHRRVIVLGVQEDRLAHRLPVPVKVGGSGSRVRFVGVGVEDEVSGEDSESVAGAGGEDECVELGVGAEEGESSVAGGGDDLSSGEGGRMGGVRIGEPKSRELSSNGVQKSRQRQCGPGPVQIHLLLQIALFLHFCRSKLLRTDE